VSVLRAPDSFAAALVREGDVLCDVEAAEPADFAVDFGGAFFVDCTDDFVGLALTEGLPAAFADPVADDDPLLCAWAAGGASNSTPKDSAATTAPARDRVVTRAMAALR
jgi:hypothetical protein